MGTHPDKVGRRITRRNNRKINKNAVVTFVGLICVIAGDLFYAAMCWKSGTIPTDAWCMAHLGFWGVELALNYGIYKAKKAVHIDGTGGFNEGREE